MKVRCYREGHIGSTVRHYELQSSGGTPMPSAVEAFAKVFVRDHGEEHGYDPVNVIVEPDDDEARAMPGWHAPEGPDERPFRMFMSRAHVRVEWEAHEVQTLNPFSPKYVDPWTRKTR